MQQIIYFYALFCDGQCEIWLWYAYAGEFSYCRQRRSKHFQRSLAIRLMKRSNITLQDYIRQTVMMA